MHEAGFHYDVGKFKCTIFSDGTLVNQDSEDDEVFGLNCIFINSGNHRVLIDTGCGDIFQSTAGRLLRNMEAAGIRCLDIDRVIFTHGHIDHVGGNFDSKGKPVFPNTRYITSESEWEYWVSQPGSNELQNMFFDAARKNLLPIGDRFDLVEDDAEVLAGIKLKVAPGHTPGNIMIDISSGSNRLLCIGDVIHSEHEFINPRYLSSFDVNPEQALETRTRVLSEVANSGVPVFACHFRFPGLGHIVQSGNRFSWQPI